MADWRRTGHGNRDVKIGCDSSLERFRAQPDGQMSVYLYESATMKHVPLALAVVLPVLPAALHAVEPTRKTNIVVIYADDLGYGDVQCYNPKRGKIPTPNIDRLAAAGMRFTDAHSSSGVCSPSRYTLLTGRYHWRTRLQAGIVGLWGVPLIAPDRLTIAELAKRHGYRTACIGKWHLGWDWSIPPESKKYFLTGGYGGKKDITATDAHLAAWRAVFSKSIEGGPVTRGFDEYFGTDVPNWPPYCFIENNRTSGMPTEFAAPALFRRNQASVQGPALKDWTLEPILPALGAGTGSAPVKAGDTFCSQEQNLRLHRHRRPPSQAR
jgi:arylsulfatase A